MRSAYFFRSLILPINGMRLNQEYAPQFRRYSWLYYPVQALAACAVYAAANFIHRARPYAGSLLRLRNKQDYTVRTSDFLRFRRYSITIITAIVMLSG